MSRAGRGARTADAVSGAEGFGGGPAARPWSGGASGPRAGRFNTLQKVLTGMIRHDPTY
jgi:hypothetical protein